MDAATDERYKLMTHEERGIYRDLLDHQWLHGSIPSDQADLLTLIGRITPDHLAEIWPKISPCFASLDAGRLQNKRLERQRIALQAFKKTKSVSGRIGGLKSGHTRRLRMRSTATILLEAKRSSSSSSSSSTSSSIREEEYKLTGAKTAPVPAPPNGNGNGHGNDSTTFIDWFVIEYQRYREANYLVLWPRDRKLVNTMLKATPLAKLQDMALLLLTTGDEWISRTERSIPMLSSKFNWLSDHLPKSGPAGIVGRDPSRGRTGYEPGKYADICRESREEAERAGREFEREQAAKGATNGGHGSSRKTH